jgi:excisionase family DNA binding protein
MEPFGFDKLPEIVRQLFEKVEHIEKMLQKFELKVIEENQLLNVSEAADFLKISTASLYTKVSRKEIPVSKPGKRLYFVKAELQEWVKLGQRKTSAEISHDANLYKAHRKS